MIDISTQNWIKSYEGLKLEAYLDTSGHLTIGWGRNLADGIRMNEAELMFQNDLQQALIELSGYQWFTNSPKNVQNALLNMNFNLGINHLIEFKEMIEALSVKDYVHAAQEA